MNVLLLDTSLQPLSVISTRRLATLLSKQRVGFLTPEQERLVLESALARRFVEDPVVVRLVSNVKVPRRLIRPSRQTIYLRDDGRCQYCGVLVRDKDATLDHVLPLCRGGSKRAWDNLVLACKRCNHKKGGHTPDEAGMTLRRQPKPLSQEYATVLFLRYPRLREAYEQIFAV